MGEPVDDMGEPVENMSQSDEDDDEDREDEEAEDDEQSSSSTAGQTIPEDTTSTTAPTLPSETPKEVPPPRPSQSSSSKSSRSWGSSIVSLISFVSTKLVQRSAQPERPRGPDRLIRRFRFLTRGVLREVQLAHDRDRWHVKLDSAVIQSRSHRWGVFSDEKAHIIFMVPVPGLLPPANLSARLDMHWKAIKSKWYYELTVGETKVPACWIIQKENLGEVTPPEVVATIDILEEAREERTVTEDRATAHGMRGTLNEENRV
mmetsp:Transcript_23047/g.42464  ORF Transcript_23047/g.42464 Transcript_23047/m.42464 type:complete len:261 (+) Transcript_23047:82-864(+)